ncbi:HARLDQ motif MBL-fold protein [Pseudescherichia sp.]|uniref:HARLDQ motif MBL-fold protein n=1 Tax=Pseudescherichia sp. TaxID=2055881 RepID=UPI00289B12C5|nr:HARLDQ motif MBL-fold protein [Pseudescherichia sp.]
MSRSGVIFSCFFYAASFSCYAALDPAQPLSEAPPYSLFTSWGKPVKPFRITDNVWYVGMENLSSVLITTPQGHILIDGALDENALQIKRNIEALGFNMRDVRLILNSHARLDQAGGIAKLKSWSGAKLVASQPNADQMARGGKDDFALGDALTFPAVKTDKIVYNNTILKLGNVSIKTLLTPGHLPGSTSWLFSLPNGKKMIYADSLATPGYYLVDNKNYPAIIDDMHQSFKTLALQHVDIFIANKGERFNLLDKKAELDAGDNNAFIDTAGLQKYVEKSKQSFEIQLKQQLSK